MPEGNLLSTMTQVTWGKEHPVELDLTGSTIPAYGSPARTIIGLSGLTVNQYRGQTAYVMPKGGNADGQVLHIIENDATSITFEELVEQNGAFPTGIVLATTDTLIITQVGKVPSDLSNYFGHLEESEFPTSKYSGYKLFAHGSAEKPARHQYIRTGVEYGADLPIRLTTGKLLALALGKCVDDGSNAQSFTDTTKTLDHETVPGQRTIHSTGHGLSASGQYLQIGDASTDDAEIRQVASVTTDTITFTEPLQNEHDSGEKIYTVVVGTGYIEHTLSPSIRLPSWSLKKTMFRHKSGNITGVDDCKVYPGLKVASLKLEHSIGDDLLQPTFSVVGLDEDGSSETDRESVGDYSEYNGITPYYFKGSVVQINGVQYHQAGDFKGGIDREISTRTYANSYRGIKPTEHNEGTLESDFSITIPLHNRNLWDLLISGAEFEVKYKFYRDGDAVNNPNDYLELQFKNCVLEEATESLPNNQGEVDVEHVASPSHLEIVVRDQIPYY